MYLSMKVLLIDSGPILDIFVKVFQYIIYRYIYNIFSIYCCKIVHGHVLTMPLVLDLAQNQYLGNFQPS